eukprot:scaffold3927_cov152-Skeletonema_menzelii.AAC.7
MRSTGWNEVSGCGCGCGLCSIVHQICGASAVEGGSARGASESSVTVTLFVTQEKNICNHVPKVTVI